MKELLKYIRGKRSGNTARRLEYDSLKDPFLRDAVKGYLSSDADHSAGLARLEALATGTRPGPERSYSACKKILVAGIIAALSVIVAVVVSRSGETAENPATESGAPAAPGVHTHGDKPGGGFHNSSGGRVPDTEYAGAVTPEGVGPENSAPAGKVTFAIGIPYGETPTESDIEKTYRSVPRVGAERFGDYLSRALVVPEDAERGKTVVATFRVNRYGRPSSIRIEPGTPQSMNREVIRLIESGPEWTPTEERVMLSVTFP